MAEPENIQVEHQDPSYFAMIPFMVIDDLDPYELALYCQLKRVGKCYMANKTLAQATGMSVSKLKQTRVALKKKGLIRVSRKRVKMGAEIVENTTMTITVVDIWAKNHAKYDAQYQAKSTGGGSSENGGGGSEKTPKRDSFSKRDKDSFSDEKGSAPSKEKDGDSLSESNSSKKPTPGDGENYQALENVVKELIFDNGPDDEVSGRVKGIALWLNGNREKWNSHELGYIRTPAKPEHVHLFVEEWAEDLALPRVAYKFVERWRAWAKNRQVAAEEQVNAPTLEEVEAEFYQGQETGEK